jgi:NAD(P)-dependent dehydrogenase (short-subunit alcohol dehydrogenase family)
LAFTRQVALEYAPDRIRANGIAPGLIETPLVRVLPGEMRDRSIRETLLGRIGYSKDIADLAVFLASDASSFITGQTLLIDGGRSIF